MRAPRFRWPLAAALCVHIAGAIAVSRMRTPNLRGSTSAAEPLEIALVDEPVLLAPTTSLAAARDPLPRSIDFAPKRAEQGMRPSEHQEPAPHGPSDVPSEEANGTWSLPSVSSSMSGSPTPSPIDLGIGSYWKSAAANAAPPSPEHAPRSVDDSAKLTRTMRDELHAHDVALGLASGGPIVSAAHEAAGPSIGPDVGSATFDVECDGEGRAITARIVDATADLPAWNAVSRELLRILSTKRMRLTSGAHGLRTRLRIIAERTSPSGEKVAVNAGAIPDDAPGSESACDGVGIRRRCTKGMPVGVTVTGADVANAVGRAIRIVRVHLLGEVEL